MHLVSLAGATKVTNNGRLYPPSSLTQVLGSHRYAEPGLRRGVLQLVLLGQPLVALLEMQHKGVVVPRLLVHQQAVLHRKQVQQKLVLVQPGTAGSAGGPG